MAQLIQDNGNNFVLQPDSTGNISLVMQGTTMLSIDQTNTIRTAGSTTFTFSSAPGYGNVLNSTNQLGYYINTTASKNQVYNAGFTFDQDGDILTPVNKTRYAFAYTGANQTFTVPTGVNWIYVKLWGAGGGAGRAGGWTYGADGGGGGHTRGLVPVTPGATIIVVVGSGGFTCNGANTIYGGGGTGSATAPDNQYSGMGGGYCGVFTGSVSQANALAVAGGGGGGGSVTGQYLNFSYGGAGGGSIAQRGMSAQTGTRATGGGGASTNAGGIAGTGNITGANAGTALAGGNNNQANYGGGGGGGYWGGGGGAYTNNNIMGGGGGGSGFLVSTARLSATYTGQYRTPAVFWDNDLVLGANNALIELPGYGGQNVQNNLAAATLSGGHAYAVIYY